MAHRGIKHPAVMRIDVPGSGAGAVCVPVRRADFPRRIVHPVPPRSRAAAVRVSDNWGGLE